MAWSWSHSSEAYSNAREQLDALERADLEIIAAEWMACPNRRANYPQFDGKRYQTALARVRMMDDGIYRWSHDRLVEFIWDLAEDQAICTNGGWEAWMCPFGCVCHTVTFDPVAV